MYQASLDPKLKLNVKHKKVPANNEMSPL